MAILVVDASVVIACVTGEPERDRILRAAGHRDLVAPGSLDWEVGNALSAGFKRGRFSLAQAEAALDLYRKMSIARRAVDLHAAVRLAHRVKIWLMYRICCSGRKPAAPRWAAHGSAVGVLNSSTTNSVHEPKIYAYDAYVL